MRVYLSQNVDAVGVNRGVSGGYGLCPCLFILCSQGEQILDSARSCTLKAYS